LTDGVISKRLVSRLTDGSKPEASASALVRVGLWHEGEHDCPQCPLSGPDAYVIHDYLEHQRSASEVADLRAKRAAAGQRGGKRSGESRREASAAEANSEASASAKAKQARSKNEPETETETEEEKDIRGTSSKSTETGPRDDIEAVCKHLADRLEKSGSKRPRVSAKWRNDTRLLLDRDGITPEQAIAAIDWALADDFWQAHILSPLKLRQKYDQMRRQATAEQRKRNGSAGAPRSDAPKPDPRANWPDWCKDPDCDEITRRRQVEDSTGIRTLVRCQQCHPDRKESAA
jgi:hypothetical protein